MDRMAKEDRVMGLVRAAGRLAEPSSKRRDLCHALVASTGLSVEGVALALDNHLETNPSPDEVASLIASAGDAPTVHVVLSANVFVGSLRALALAVATAPRVFVHASRREPSFTEALLDAIDSRPLRSSITSVERVTANAGDEVHLYGRDEPMGEICQGLPPDVRVRAHGTGIGVAVVATGIEPEEAAAKIAQDVVPFDQRGCLSPRIALVEGDLERVGAVARALCRELARWQRAVPLGRLEPVVQAEQARYRDTALMLGDVLRQGTSVVGVVGVCESLLLPPPGRNLHMVACSDAVAAAHLIPPWSRYVTALGFAARPAPAGSSEIVREVQRHAPMARVSKLGCMQTPPFDGPVDGRHGAASSPAEVLARLPLATSVPTII